MTRGSVTRTRYLETHHVRREPNDRLGDPGHPQLPVRFEQRAAVEGDETECAHEQSLTQRVRGCDGSSIGPAHGGLVIYGRLP